MTAMDPPHSLKVLGPFALGNGVRLPTRKAEALLAYLAMAAGRPHSRDVLAALLWGDRAEKQARHSLSQTLFAIRKVLLESAPDSAPLTVDGDQVFLATDHVFVDAIDFERLSADGSVPALASASALYRGELLQGMNLGELAFEEWLTAERSRFRETALGVFGRLLEAHERAGDLERAVQAALRLVAADRLQEGGHRALMRLYLALGRPAAALRQYDLYAATLQRELGIEPEAEMRRLRSEVMNRRRRTAAPSTAADAPRSTPDITPAPAAETPPPTPVHGEAVTAERFATAERKSVTVLCAGVAAAGHAIDEVDPEHALEWTEPVASDLVRHADRFGGTVCERRADGIMVVFGAPVAIEDHAVRGCHAALAMRGEVASRWGERISIRISLHTGEAVVRMGSEAGAGNCRVDGPVLHVASAIEHLLPFDSIAVSGDVVRRAGAYFRLAPGRTLTLPGLRSPLTVHELEDFSSVRTRWDVQAARGLSPFVGRGAEMEVLRTALAGARTGTGEVVAVIGDPGVGKSRLVNRFLQSSDGATVLYATAFPHESAAYQPLRRMLREWLHAEADEPASVTADRLRRALDACEPALVAATPALAWLMGLPTVDPGWESLGPAQHRRHAFEAAAGLLAALSRGNPLILVVEDLHWADEGTLALLDVLVQASPGLRLMMILTFRPEYRDPWAGRAQHRVCRIGPLDADPARGLLNMLLGPDPGLAGLKEDLLRITNGNPLFLEESVRALAEGGDLVGDPGGYRLSEKAGETPIPPTVQDVIAARIDRLPQREKWVLQTAAVLGAEFGYRLLAEIAGLSEEDLHDALRSLQQTEHLFQTAFFPQQEYAFRHALIRQVAYGSLPRTRRAAMHAEAALALERLCGEDLGDTLEKLAEHCESGELWSKAAEYLLRAARKSKERYGYRRAALLARRADEAAARLPEGANQGFRVDASTLLGDLASLEGDIARANDYYDLAAALEAAPRRRRRITNRRHCAHGIVRDGTRLVYYEHGTGPETLLFINPIVYGLPIFQPVIEQLCQEFRIVTIDARGTGASGPLLRPCSARTHQADLEAVVDALGGGPVVGVGISRGSNLLVRIACERPGVVNKLVLVGPPVDDAGPASRFPRSGAKMIEQMLAEGRIREVAESMVSSVFSEPGSQDIAATFLAGCLGMPRETFISFFDPDPDYDMTSLLPNMTIPTLVVFGSHDRRVSLGCGHYIVERAPRASLHLFEGRGHLPIFTATTEFCHLLRQFVRTGHSPKPSKAGLSI